MLSIYSVFAGDGSGLETATATLDDPNVSEQPSVPAEYAMRQNFDYNPLLPPPTMEEEILLSVNVSSVSISAETEMISYQTGESAFTSNRIKTREWSM